MPARGQRRAAWMCPFGGLRGSGPLSARRPQSLDSEARTSVQTGPSLDGGSVHETALHGPPAELVAVGELQFPQHRRHVRLDRLGRDMESRPDLLVEVAASDVLEDLALAGGELVEL